MPSVTPQRFDNDVPQPHMEIIGEDPFVNWLEYLPDGRRIVTGSCHKGTMRVWNLESGKQEGKTMEHGEDINELTVTRGDGTKIVSSDEDGKIRVWDVESRKTVKEWTHPQSYSTIAISPDDRLIAVGYKNVDICTMEGRHVNSIEVEFVYSMRFSPDGNKLACGTGYGIRVYDINSGMLITILGPSDRLVTTVLWSHDGSKLFSGSDGSDDETIRCWNSDTGQQIGHPWTGHTDIICLLSLSPDGSVLASASLDKTVRFWNATTGDPIGQRLQHDKAVSAVRFSPSGEFVASTGWDRKIRLWRVPWSDPTASRTSLANLDAPRHTLHRAQVFPLNPPPPYSIHSVSAEQASHFDLGMFMAPHPITSPVVSNPHPSLPTSNSNPDDIGSSGMLSMSHEVDLQYIVPHSSLGLDECQRIFELRLRKLVDLATSNGLRVPHELIPSNSPRGVCNAPWIRQESTADINQSSMSVFLIVPPATGESADILWWHASQSEPSTSVFRSAPNGDPKKIRKIDAIKQKLVEMLREIGFKLSNGRLPWSTLEGDLQKKGYVILNWPQGVLRDKDKGVSGLSAEDANKLHDALFVDEERLRFVPHGNESERNDGFSLVAVASGSARPRESDHSMAGKQARFRVTTAEAYPHKKRRVFCIQPPRKELVHDPEQAHHAPADISFRTSRIFRAGHEIAGCSFTALSFTLSATLKYSQLSKQHLVGLDAFICALWLEGRKDGARR
ncbi:quinon protein alcohol dehydrogenase-like superfamily [Boletus coccyginus]|nr:quinon protein alcohol dehydrogenase-like superfamily [Boletus coccyginus]